MLTAGERQKIREEEAFRARSKAIDLNPPRGSFLKAINSPIVLWLLSTIVIGWFTSIYTERKACLASIDNTMNHFSRLRTEIVNRVAIIPLKRGSPDPEAVRKFLSSQAQYTFVEFDRRTLADLTIEFDDLVSKKLYVGTVQRTLKIDGVTFENSVRYITPSIKTPAVLQSIDGTVEGFKKSGDEILKYVTQMVYLLTFRLQLKPIKSCSVVELSSALIGLGTDPPIISMSVDQLFKEKEEEELTIHDIMQRFGDSIRPKETYRVGVTVKTTYNSGEGSESDGEYTLRTDDLDAAAVNRDR